MSSVSSSSNSSGSSGSGGSSAHATAPPAADALPLTADHTPLLVAERERIESCGGKVGTCTIIDGDLKARGGAIGRGGQRRQRLF